MTIVALKRKPERVMLRVVQGALEPADQHSRAMLRDRGYKVGDVVAGELKKINNPKFNRLHHRIGQLCVSNIDAFHGMSCHQALKRIQWEANIWCEEVGVVVPGVGLAMMRFPLSLSFDNLDDGGRREVVRGMCRHISEKYWPSLSPEKIEEMAESWVDEI